MKRSSFRPIAGGLIAAIIVLAIVAADLGIAIIDREIRLRSTEIAWPSATADGQMTAILSVSPTATVALMPATLAPPTQPIPSLAPGGQTLPKSHPEIGPNPPPCMTCHKSIHGGGG